MWAAFSCLITERETFGFPPPPPCEHESECKLGHLSPPFPAREQGREPFFFPSSSLLPLWLRTRAGLPPLRTFATILDRASALLISDREAFFPPLPFLSIGMSTAGLLLPCYDQGYCGLIFPPLTARMEQRSSPLLFLPPHVSAGRSLMREPLGPLPATARDTDLLVF